MIERHEWASSLGISKSDLCFIKIFLSILQLMHKKGVGKKNRSVVMPGRFRRPLEVR